MEKMYEIQFLGEEERVCAMTLRPQGVTPKAQNTLKTFLKLVPKSHKRYAFTCKVVSNTMLTFLTHTDNYYQNFMQCLLQAFPYIRNSIFTIELDSTGRKHIHGILTCSRNFDLSYKRLNDKFPGHSLHLTKLSKPPSEKERRYDNTTTPISSNNPCPKTNGYKHPNKWFRYILKDSKEIHIVAFKNLKLKYWVTYMTICHTTEDTDVVDLAEAAKVAATLVQQAKLLQLLTVLKDYLM